MSQRCLKGVTRVSQGVFQVYFKYISMVFFGFQVYFKCFLRLSQGCLKRVSQRFLKNDSRVSQGLFKVFSISHERCSKFNAILGIHNGFVPVVLQDSGTLVLAISW